MDFYYVLTDQFYFSLEAVDKLSLSDWFTMFKKKKNEEILENFEALNWFVLSW